MKKIFLAIVMVVFFNAADGQDIRFGVKGAFNSTWLINSNLADRGETAEYEASWGTNIGLAGNYYFTENMALSFDVLFTTHTQTFYGSYTDSVSYFGYNGTIILNYIDVPVLFRISSEGGPYVEIGPQIGILMSAKEDYYRASSALSIEEYRDMDFKKDFSSIDLAAVIGFGYDIPVADNFFVNIGLRFGYSFLDTSVKHPEEEFAIRRNHSEFSRLSTYNFEEDYEYQENHRAFGGLMMGLILAVD